MCPNVLPEKVVVCSSQATCVQWQAGARVGTPPPPQRKMQDVLSAGIKARAAPRAKAPGRRQCALKARAECESARRRGQPKLARSKTGPNRVQPKPCTLRRPPKRHYKRAELSPGVVQL